MSTAVVLAIGLAYLGVYLLTDALAARHERSKRDHHPE